LNKSFQAIMMQPHEVARLGVDAMFARDECQVSGLINKISSALPRFLPASMLVRSVGLFMK
jgi:short-subunit dehydrogenase